MLQTLKQYAYTFLSWSERLLKTDIRYLVSGGFWLVMGRLLVMLSGLILSIAFANLLPKETYGTYQYVMSVASIISLFTLTKMSTAIARAVAQGSEGALRYGFHVQMMWSIGIVLAGAAAAIYYFVQENVVLGFSFLIVGSMYPFLAGFSLTQAYLFGKRDFRGSVMLGFWRRLVPTVALLGTVLLTQDPALLVLVYFVSNTISAGLIYISIVKKYSLPYTEDSSMISYSKHLSLMAIFSGIVSQLDDVLLFHYFGATSLAIYTLALLPVQQLEALFGLIGSLTFPKMAVKTFDELKRAIPYKAHILFGAAVLCVVAYIAAAPYFFRLFFPSYPEAILFSQVAVLLLLAKPRTLYAQLFTTHGMKREQYVSTVVTNVTRLGLLLLLLPSIGIWGAVAALLGTQLVVNILTRYQFHKATAPDL